MSKLFKNKLFNIFFVLIVAFALISCNGTPNEEDEDEIKYTVEDLDSKYTDELKLSANFSDKLFILDGIEEVSLLRNIDGDTTHFLDKNNRTIKIRYLGINTPESTAKIAPWGKQASQFVANKLKNAVSIVIEAETLNKAPETDTTGDSYLGYVWYKTTAADDYRLLNLEIIENCFSIFTGGSQDLKYGNTMREAHIEKSKMNLRVYGEKDPEFNYDLTIQEITIAELRNNYSSYSTGSKLKLKVRVVRIVGNSLYVEDIEDTVNEDTGEVSRSGIFLYHSFVPGIGKYEPGQVISFLAQASIAGDYGMQLVNPASVRSHEKSDYVIQEIAEDVTSLESFEGFVVKIPSFTVTDKYKSQAGAYTIYGTVPNGAEMQVRVDADTSPQLAYDYIEVGSEYYVIGGVSKYVDPFQNGLEIFQLKLGNLKHDGKDDFKKIE